MHDYYSGRRRMNHRLACSVPRDEMSNSRTHNRPTQIFARARVDQPKTIREETSRNLVQDGAPKHQPRQSAYPTTCVNTCSFTLRAITLQRQMAARSDARPRSRRKVAAARSEDAVRYCSNTPRRSCNSCGQKKRQSVIFSVSSCIRGRPTTTKLNKTAGGGPRK